LKITAPQPDARIRLEDIDLADTGLYTDRDAHLVFQTLRSQCPVFWQSRAGGEGFWAVTRRADVRRVLSEYESFSSEGGTALSMLDTPDPAAGIMMHATDPPRHRELRRELGGRFSAQVVPGYEERIDACVRRAMEPAMDCDDWDVAQAFLRLPMDVGAFLMGLPDADVEPLLRLAYTSLAPHDPHYAMGAAPPAVCAAAAHTEILGYFADHICERRARPGDDVISHLISLQIDGAPLDENAVAVNCLSLLLGAVVTTSQVISSLMLALAEQHGGEGRWPAGGSVAALVEEGLRWSSPVIHFMRRARRDVELHGVTLRAGDAVTAWIASANRDESAFDRPYALDPARSPNRHLAFGTGPHLCLGANLARLVLATAFRRLMAVVETFEIAGPAVHLVSNEIAGLVSLPVRTSSRPGSQLRHLGARVSS
jgi:cytochrome P450